MGVTLQLIETTQGLGSRLASFSRSSVIHKSSDSGSAEPSFLQFSIDYEIKGRGRQGLRLEVDVPEAQTTRDAARDDCALGLIQALGKAGGEANPTDVIPPLPVAGEPCSESACLADALLAIDEFEDVDAIAELFRDCLLYTSPSPRD